MVVELAVVDCMGVELVGVDCREPWLVVVVCTEFVLAVVVDCMGPWLGCSGCMDCTSQSLNHCLIQILIRILNQSLSLVDRIDLMDSPMDCSSQTRI